MPRPVHTIARSAAAAAVAAALLCTGLAGPANAAEPPLNGKIAFIRLNDVFVMNPDGTNKTALTDTKALEGEAVFSPDGTKIAFVRTPRDGGLRSDQLVVMNADGSGAVNVDHADGPDVIQSPAWTTDGSRVLYLADRIEPDNNRAEIYAAAADGSAETVVTAEGPIEDEGGGGIATAGSKVVFWSGPTGILESEIFVINTDGTGRTQISHQPGSITPAISPDASKVAWTASDGVFVANVDGGDQRRVAKGSGPLFSPDGSRIAFDAKATVATVNVDGTAYKKVAGGKRRRADWRFVRGWSPDGKLIAMARGLKGFGEWDPDEVIYTARARGGHERLLTSRDDRAFYSDWQATTAPSPEPQFELVAKARKMQRSAAPRAKVTCSRECDLALLASGRVGGETINSRVEAHGYGDYPSSLKVLDPTAATTIRGESATITVKVTATDDEGATRRATLRIRVAD